MLVFAFYHFSHLIRCSEPSTRVTKTSRTITTSSSGNTLKPNVNRELKFDSPSLVSSVTHESRTRQRSRSPNYQKQVESEIVRDVGYDVEPVLDTTPTSTTKRSYNYSKTSSSSKTNVTPYSTEIVEVDTGSLPAELKDVPLSNDLLPGPGTKVTTTVSSFGIMIEVGGGKLIAMIVRNVLIRVSFISFATDQNVHLRNSE